MPTMFEILAARRAERAEHTKARNTVNQAARRARLRKAEAAEVSDIVAALGGTEPVEPVRLTRAEWREEAACLLGWLKIGGARQRQYNRDRKRYLRGRVALVELRRERGINPAPLAFAERYVQGGGKLNPDPTKRREEAKRLMRAVARLEAHDGPWPNPVTGGGAPSRAGDR